MITPVMTDIESMVAQWLSRNKIVFSFQLWMAGGPYELGGSVVDFTLDELGIALRVMGEYWHRGISKSGSDLIQKESLSAQGWRVIDLWEDDIKNRLEETMLKALRGEEMLA